MIFVALFASAIFSVLELPALALRAKAALEEGLYAETSRVAADAQISSIQARIASIKLLSEVGKHLWMPDELTSFGSMLPAAVEGQLPVLTFYLGFDGCEGSKLLGKVLSMHPGSIVGNSLEKNYFKSKTKGHCNRFAARDGVTEYDKYLRSCFHGKIPTLNRTTLDFSQSYTEQDSDSIRRKMKKMEGDAHLRFLSVICEPRQRAVTAVQEELLAKNGNATYVTADDISNSLSHGLRKHRAGSYSGIIGVGEYSKILSGWAEDFSLESILVINSEHLDDIQTWRRIFSHIGLRVPSEWRVRKWLDAATTKPADELEVPALTPDDLEHFVMKRLDKHYSRHDESLWNLLDVRYW